MSLLFGRSQLLAKARLGLVAPPGHLVHRIQYIPLELQNALLKVAVRHEHVRLELLSGKPFGLKPLPPLITGRIAQRSYEWPSDATTGSVTQRGQAWRQCSVRASGECGGNSIPRILSNTSAGT